METEKEKIKWIRLNFWIIFAICLLTVDILFLVLNIPDNMFNPLFIMVFLLLLTPPITLFLVAPYYFGFSNENIIIKSILKTYILSWIGIKKIEIHLELWPQPWIIITQKNGEEIRSVISGNIKKEI